jgi:hypothetical protein
VKDPQMIHLPAFDHLELAALFQGLRPFPRR